MPNLYVLKIEVKTKSHPVLLNLRDINIDISEPLFFCDSFNILSIVSPKK